MSDEAYKTKITNHKIQLLKPEGDDDHTVASCSIVVNDCISISGLRIIQQNGRYTVKWPMNPYYAGTKHLAYPTHKLFREYVEDSLISAYSRIIGNEKVTALLVEMENLKALKVNAIKEGKEDLANAYGKAVEYINDVIKEL